MDNDEKPVSNNKQLIDQGNEALSNRTEWEKKLAQFQLQRYCQDRPDVNNYPWPDSSNLRYPFSDTLIDQKKPFLFKLLYSSETVAHFKALIAANVPLASMAEKYFDFVIREKTDFEEEIQYCIDTLLQDGETYTKITWDLDHEVPDVEHIESLFIITPGGTRRLQEAEWVYHVLQRTPNQVKEQFKDVPGIEDFVKRWKDGGSLRNDVYEKSQAEYDREGINRSWSKDGGMIVLWECHYMKNGQKMIKTVSPDEQDFDFKDEHGYPYEYPKAYKIKWMFEQGRREFTSKNLHSSRGIPEVVQEGEFILSALQRAKHNAMTLYNNPSYFAPDGIPGSTQNVNLVPGSITPFNVQILQHGNPPISWDVEMNQTKQIWEQRAAAPNFSTKDQGGDNRTAREVSLIAGQQALNVELESGNWKMFTRRVLRQCWALIVQYKPKSLLFYMENSTAELPSDALNPEFSIVVSASAESLNREVELQKADMLMQRSMNNPFAQPYEAWKNLVQILKPGEVQRFSIDPAARQQQLTKKVASDLSLITELGFPSQPDQTDDPLQVIRTVLQLLQAFMQKGRLVDPDHLALFGAYVKTAREILAKTKKAGVQEADQMIQEMQMITSQMMAQTNMIPMQPMPAQGIQ